MKLKSCQSYVCFIAKHSRAMQRPCIIHQRIIQIYYYLGLSFVIWAIFCICYDNVILTKVIAEIWEHSDNENFNRTRNTGSQTDRQTGFTLAVSLNSQSEPGMSGSCFTFVMQITKSWKITILSSISVCVDNDFMVIFIF